MNRYLCGALCALVCSTANAREATTGTSLTDSRFGEDIFRRCDAELAIATPNIGPGVGDVNLYDAASFELKSGNVHGFVTLYDSFSVDVRGGLLGNDVFDVKGGSTTLNISAGKFNRNLRFTRGGVQELTIAGWEHAGGTPLVLGSQNTSLTYIVKDSPFYVEHNHSYRDLMGVIASIQPSLLKSIELHDVRWSLDATEQLPADTHSNGVVDFTDLNNVRNFFGTRHWASATLPFDGIVSIADLNTVRNSFGATSRNAVATVPRPSGDADGDGDIDGHDLAAVRTSFGEFGVANGTLLGDTLPFDGRVNIQDLNNVRNARVVSEPSTAVLLLGVVACAVITRRSGRSSAVPNSDTDPVVKVPVCKPALKRSE